MQAPFKYIFKGCFVLQENNLSNHNIILQNRKNLSISAVKDCLGFDDETINLLTSAGKITVKGNGLHIVNFNTETGEFTAEGKINAVVYTVDETTRGFFAKLFK